MTTAKPLDQMTEAEFWAEKRAAFMAKSPKEQESAIREFLADAERDRVERDRQHRLAELAKSMPSLAGNAR